jgi:FKBP-type peptidyl-prolyl cis-trans isomerase SlyD
VKIENGRRVRLKVKLKAVDGAEIEKSVVEYIHGSGTMLPGLEHVLDGLEAGGKRQGVIKAVNAFGDVSFQREKRMSRKEFPKDAKLKVGDRFMAKGADNQQNVILEVFKLTGDDVIVHLRHPLADTDIEYDVHVLQVTDPKPPPLPATAFARPVDD